MNHLRVWRMLQSQGLCKLMGVVDTRPEILNSVAKDFDVETSPDFRFFLDKKVDAMDIVTPTDTHYQICKECLKAGKHVIVEKPLTTSYSEAKELVKKAEEQGKILMAGHIFRYNSAVHKLRELIDQNEVGQIYYMWGHFTGLKDPRWDSGALFNYTTHHIDIYAYLLRKTPEEVLCHTGSFLGREKFEDVALVVLKYPPNILGVIEGSWLSPSKSRDLTVVGSRRSITSDLLRQKLVIHNSHIENRNGALIAVESGIEKIDFEFEEPLMLELRDFIRCIKTGERPLAAGKFALEVVRIAEKALESSRLGRSVQMGEE
jgi:UDP-N-acetylglucosamine 3-dehydrogenase